MYDFTSSAASRSANDTIGHGSHTASTMVGNHWEAPFGGGTFTISGIAPVSTILTERGFTVSSIAHGA